MANVAEQRITALPGPPAIYQTFLAHPDLDLDRLQSLRLAVTGAAPVPVELIERMERELGFETVVTAYGLTETCRLVTVCRPDDPPGLIDRKSTTSELQSLMRRSYAVFCLKKTNVKQQTISTV